MMQVSVDATTVHEELETPTGRQTVWKRVAWCVGLVIVFLLLGKLAFWISLKTGTLNAVFYINAIALPAILILGARIWPGLLMGQVMLAINIGVSPLTSVFLALSQTISVLVSDKVLQRLHFNKRLLSMRDYLILLGVMALAMQPLSAACTGAVMWWDGVVGQEEMGRSLFYWWLNNLMGSIIMTPALLVLWQLRRSAHTQRPLWQLCGTIVLASVLLTLLLLGTVERQIQPMHFFSLAQIFLMGLTLLFGIQGAALGALVITALVQVYSFSGYGPFAAVGDLEERLLYINTFILGLTITAGLVGALISEKSLHQKHLELQAYTDPLTQLFNRRYFYEQASRKLGNVQRYGGKVGLLWLDVDHFKKINDTHGHPAGDAVLQKLASLLQAHYRMQDLKARMGGEEFAILLADCEDIHGAAEKLLELIRGSDAQPGESLPSFRISIGGTMMRPGDLTVDDAMRRADLALYQAKEGGRDRAVVVA